MKELWSRISAKVDALSQRERLSVLIALVVVSVFVVFTIGVEPAQRRAQTLRAQIIQQKAQLRTLQNQVQPQQGRGADPDAANRAKVQELERRLEALDATLKAMQRDLVSADRMNALLHEMLTRDPGLQLVSLRTLPAAPLFTKEEADNGKVAATGVSTAHTEHDPNVYMHGVEIRLTGGYANLHAYLARLERSPWRMYWSRARMISDQDARLTLIITIYTLSLDKAWLQV